MIEFSLFSFLHSFLFFSFFHFFFFEMKPSGLYLIKSMLYNGKVLGIWWFLMGMDRNYRGMDGNCREIDLI